MSLNPSALRLAKTPLSLGPFGQSECKRVKIKDKYNLVPFLKKKWNKILFDRQCQPEMSYELKQARSLFLESSVMTLIVMEKCTERKSSQNVKPGSQFMSSQQTIASHIAPRHHWKQM